MQGRPWQAWELWRLFDYKKVPLSELAEELGRTEDSVRVRAQKLNMSDDYNCKKPVYTIEIFCEDCVENRETCGRNMRDCLSEAGTYRKFYDLQ